MKRMAMVVFGVLFGCCAASQAQWAQQTVSLTNGWNAVYLTVQPYPSDIDSQMAGLPVRAIHRCARVFSTEQFSSSVDSPLDRAAEWLVWYPEASPHHVVNTLSAFLGNTAYLIECYEDGAVWTVTGRPTIPSHTWVPAALNFVGLPVNSEQAPTFASFFSGSSAIDTDPDPEGGKVFKVLASGAEQDISSQTATETMKAGVAYWIKAEGISDYVGPTQISTPAGGMTFDGSSAMLTFHARNDSGSDRVITVKLKTSAPPPAGQPEKIGDVPLLTFDQGGDGFYGWEVFDRDSVITETVPAGDSGSFSFAANRTQMSDHGTNATWQSLLEVTDDAGTLVRIPVSAEWGEDNPYDALWPEGLWVGTVKIDAVVYVQSDGVTDPMAVSSPFSFRLIMHQGSDGTLRLLQQVVTAWNADEEHYELQLSSEGLDSSTGEAYRVSSVVYPPKMNVVCSGNLLQGCAASFTIDAEDPTNPWRHVFNPNHDEADEALTIENAITLTPDTPASETGSAALWQPEETMTGEYLQVIRGLRKQPVTISGRYEIRRVGKIGVIEE